MIKIKYSLILILIVFISCSTKNTNDKKENLSDNSLKEIKEETSINKKTIKIKSSDGIEVTADLYEISDTTAPVILLFHQAGYSRGEYIETAPKLNKMGFTCLAVDQRSGNEVNGIKNETNKQAKEKGLGTKYEDALPDLKAALDYAKENFTNRQIILWGSSYSASLVFILGSEYQDEISAIVSFSPGEYFTYNDQKIEYYAGKVQCPVFITSAKNEHKDWEAVYNAVQGVEKTYFLPESKGKHGSRALWEKNEGHEDYWKAVTEFLSTVKSN